MRKLGLAACAAALALSATAANAGGYWQNGTYYSYPTTHSYATPSYTTPSIHIGSIDTVQPSTYTTYGTTQSYSVPTTVYTSPVYSSPSYTTPSYVAPAPSYAPTYYAPRYDGRDRVRQRLRNQRDRIERALARGDLRRGEERRLREGLREVRRTFRAWRDNDGVINQWEEAELMRMLDRNSRRIRRLANNHRVADGYYRPYGVYR